MAEPLEYRLLPHRPPFLFLDRAGRIVRGEGGRGWRLITSAEEWGRAGAGGTFPAILLIESLAQLAAAGNATAAENHGDAGADIRPPLGYLAAIDSFEWLSQVEPGDRVELEVRIERRFGAATRCFAEARVGQRAVAHGVLTFIVDTGAAAPRR
ncbi:MAG: hypothetical protein HYV63_25515 [Candidatus Schekmanbacteria bacterium]|nr:hypothetical protein [Candidatus Schekmanbacteria bacterium]